MIRLGIIGGGAAGMAAAAFSSAGSVTLIEKNEKLGKKMYITGKGRCNVTNNCALYEFFPNIIHGEKFMMSALNRFSPAQLMEFLDLNGTKCKVERGNRVFPFSDKASDVTKAFSKAINKVGVDVKLNTNVTSIEKRGDAFIVKTSEGTYEFDRLIIATGGVSYPLTGSTGDGYRFAKEFNHSMIELCPALSAIEIKEKLEKLEGVSLKNVRLSFGEGKNKISEFGEMLFTSNGISGPIVLTMSSKINRLSPEGKTLYIDFKPALAPEVLDERLYSDFRVSPNKNISNIMTGLVPGALIPFILRLANLSGQEKANSISRESRLRLGYSLKYFPVTILRLAPISEAIVTSGGIKLDEINPSTMESKKCSGLYFAGELLDIDCLTGGFNLQCAISTGRLAGISASKE